MNKIRIIDLLNKIANGEEVPKKIKWNNFVWRMDKLEEGDYFKIREDGMFDWLFGDYLHGSLISTLDDEVEVIEDNIDLDKIKNLRKEINELGMYIIGISTKVNCLGETLDKLKELDDKYDKD